MIAEKRKFFFLSTGQSSVKAAFLVDPVDNTRETPESVDYPSAAKALKSADRPVGIAGASVITGCNPAGSNWEVYSQAPAPLCCPSSSIVLYSVSFMHASIPIRGHVCTCKHLDQGPGL